MNDDSQNESQENQQQDGSDRSAVRDSRLQAFLRQASAIIAGEKGLTNAAKARLEELATRLHLPEELFEQGLEKLQNSNAPIGDLTAYENGFLKYLKKEFSRLPNGSVLTISMEETAVAIAKDKYQIAAHRAEQLVDFQTRESKLGRLSREDARIYGRQAILDQIGDQLTLDESTQKRILKLGRQWGLESVDVNELMLQQLASNRREGDATSRRRSVTIVLIAASLIGAVSAIGTWYLWNTANANSNSGNEAVRIGDSVTDPSIVPENSSSATQASSVGLAPSVGLASTFGARFPEISQALSSDDLQTRSATQKRLAEMVLDRELAPEQQKTIAEFYVAELDQHSTAQFEEHLLAATDENSLMKQSNLDAPYRFVGFAQQVQEAVKNLPDDQAHAKLKSDRLVSALADRFGINLALLTDDQDQQEIASAIATWQWNRLIRMSWSAPGRSSVLVEPMMNVTEGRLERETFELLLNRAVRTIIQADAERWVEMKDGLQRAMESSDEIRTVEWIEVYFDEYTESSPFREFAAPMLLKLVDDKGAASVDPSVRLRNFQSNYRNRLLRPALQRHAKIDATVNRLRQRLSVEESDDFASPDLLYQVVAAGNLCLEMIDVANAGRAGDETVFGEIDIQLQRSQQRLRDFVFIDDPDATGRNVMPSSGFDTTSRDRSIANLSDLSDSNRGLRRAAMAELGKLTEKFESIPQPQANIVAKYLLSPIERSEWLEVQRSVPKLIRWKRVLLAVSDQLPDSDSPLDQTLTMLNLLTGQRFEISKADSWRQEIGWQVFVVARESLSRNSQEVDPSSSDSDWIRLRKYYELALHRRAALLGSDLEDVERTPMSLAVACSNAIDESERNHRAIELIRESTSNEIYQIAMVNRLMLAAFGSRTIQETSSVSAASQLFETELDLLEHWNQVRTTQLEGMLDVE